MQTIKIIIIAILILAAENSFSQTGVETIYRDTIIGIRQFNSFELLNSPDKRIYLQEDAEYNNNFFGGIYYQLVKNSNSLIIPFNNALNPRFTSFCNFPKIYNVPIESFTVSNLSDQILILNSRISCDTISNDTTLLSTNSGISFRSIHIKNCTGFGISNNDSVIFTCGTYDLINYPFQKSTNKGQTWIITDTLQDIKKLSDGGFIKCNPFDKNIIYISGKNNLLISTNSGSNFMNTAAPSFDKIFFNNNDHSLYGINSAYLFKSTDKGLSWQIIYVSPSIEFTDLQISEENPNIIYAGTDNGIFISTNAGFDWSLYNNAFPGSNKILGLSKDIGSNSPLYACTSDGLYKVTHAYYQSNNFITHFKTGNLFQYFVNNLPGKYYYSVTVEKDTVFSNGLKYWKLITNNTASSATYEYIDSISLKWLKYDPSCVNADQYGNSLIIDFNMDTGSIFEVCSYRHVVTSKTISNNFLGDPTFLKYSSSYPYPFTSHLNIQRYVEKFGYLGSFGYSYSVNLTGAVIEGITYGVIINIENNQSTEIPGNYSLSQNYPNPFNPNTIIKFHCPKSGHVSLIIYDVLGNEVEVLASEYVSAGSYSVEWNAENYSSGIYFYRFTAGSFTDVKKMTLLK